MAFKVAVVVDSPKRDLAGIALRTMVGPGLPVLDVDAGQLGRASCRERVSLNV